MRFLSEHRFNWLVFLGYFALALVFSNTLLSNQKLVGADYAGSLSLWTTWFPPHALSNNIDISYNNYALYPLYSNHLPNLSLSTSIIYALFKPLGSVLAFNLLVPLYMALSAWGGFLLARRFVDNPRLAILGGVAFAFNPLTFAIAENGEIALLAWWVFPFWMLLFDALLAKVNLWRSMATVIGLYSIILMSAQFWNIAVSLLLPYTFFRWLTVGATDPATNAPMPRGKFMDYFLIRILGFSVLCLVYPVSALVWSTYDMRYAPLETWQGLVTLDGLAWQVFAYGGIVLIAISLLLSFRKYAHQWWWVAVIIVHLVFYWQNDLAPLTLIGDIFAVPHNPDLTHAAIFLIPVILGGVIISGQGISSLLKNTRSPIMSYAVYGIFAVAILASSNWVNALPTAPVPHYNFYRRLADDPENYLVIEYPFGIDSLARQTLVQQEDDASKYGVFGLESVAGRSLVYSPDHHKRVLGGLSDHITAAEISPYLTSPLIRMLSLQLDKTDTDAIIALKDEAIRWRAGYLIIHRNDLPPEVIDTLRGWLAWTDTFCYAGEETDIEFWRGTWHPAGCPMYRVLIGSTAGDLAIGSGWQGAEQWETGAIRWAGAERVSTLRLWITRPASDYTLTIRAMSTEAIPNQTVEVIANGESLGEIELGSDWQEFALTVPRLLIAEGGILDVELHHARSEVIDGRELTAVYEWIQLEPRSN